MSLSEERLAKLAKGREQQLIVNAYLTELRDSPPRRGRPRTADTALRERDAIEKRVASGRLPLTGELVARQRVKDLEREAARLAARQGRMERLEAEFMAVCAEYSAKRGLTRDAWAEMGVPVRVLRQCGLSKPRDKPTARLIEEIEEDE